MGGCDRNCQKIKVPRNADVLASWGGLGTKRVWENESAWVSQGCSNFGRASFIHCTDRDRVHYSASPFRFYENNYNYCNSSGVVCFHLLDERPNRFAAVASCWHHHR